MSEGKAVARVGPPLIFVGVVGLLTWLTYGMAVELAAGHPVEVSGRRRFYKEALAWAAETLGPTGTLIAGGVLVAIGLVVLCRRLASR